MMRTIRLTSLGAAIGLVAGLLATLVGGVLVAVIAAIVRSVMPDASSGTHGLSLWRAAGIYCTVSLTTAGIVAGALAAQLRASARADWRAWTTSLAAGLAWGAAATLAAHTEGESNRVQSTLGLFAVSLGIGALVAVALWSPVVSAIAAGRRRSAVRAVWAGARRVAAFTVGLLATFITAPLLVAAVGFLVRSAMGDLGRAAWGAALAILVATALAFGAAVLGLRLAGVPTRWPARTVQTPQTPQAPLST